MKDNEMICPDCDGEAFCNYNNNVTSFWVDCLNPDCQMSGPARNSMQEAIDIWERIKIESKEQEK